MLKTPFQVLRLQIKSLEFSKFIVVASNYTGVILLFCLLS